MINVTFKCLGETCFTGQMHCPPRKGEKCELSHRGKDVSARVKDVVWTAFDSCTVLLELE